jgi:hypothetical protein
MIRDTLAPALLPSLARTQAYNVYRFYAPSGTDVALAALSDFALAAA